MSFYSLIKRNEKIFEGAKNIKHFYMPPKKDSNHLIVTFSGFHGREKEGVEAAYNYVKPLSKIDCHRLFILDTYDGHPCYYIGKNKKNDYEVSVAALIFQTIGDLNLELKNVISCGSSKGGTAALYFGLKYNFGNVCVGGFQVKVGTYLNSVSKYTKEQVLGLICGGYSQSELTYLDNFFLEFFKSVTVNNTSLHLHAGNKDPHYLNHMRDFINILNQREIPYNLNLAEYDSHDYVGPYYTKYLLEKLSEITGKNIIKNIKILNKRNKLTVNVKTSDYFTQSQNVYYAFYIYNSVQREPIDFIPYSKNAQLDYIVNEIGKYRVKVFVKTGDDRITELTEYISINNI